MDGKSPYEITGDRTGKVTVRDVNSQKVIRTFSMPEGVVREVFLLNDGQIAAASQKDLSIFWDLVTGKEIKKLPQRIYGFSHDRTLFFTYHANEILLYDYPRFSLSCQPGKNSLGPEQFIFSPDNNFLAVSFASGRPEDDEHYPHTAPVRRGIRYTKLFDLRKCQEITSFSGLDVASLGKFSQDSTLYELPDSVIFLDGKYRSGSWIFNLIAGELDKPR